MAERGSAGWLESDGLTTLDTGELARLVDRTSERELRHRLIGGVREIALREIFRRMPEYLRPARAAGFDAVVDAWGGGVVAAKEDATPARPVAPVEYTERLSAPLLGLFGNDDQSPNPEQVNSHEASLQAAGKEYEFHRYDGAGHGFTYYHTPLYRQSQAMDAWDKIFRFFSDRLQP